MPQRGKTKAAIFGVGIAGLSAAHELIEKGFAVPVKARTKDGIHPLYPKEHRRCR